MIVVDEKRPRRYAQEIIALDSRELRQQALAQVPAHLRSWVKTLVSIYFELRSQKQIRV